MDTLLRLDDVVKVFGRTEAVKRISFDVKKGEIMGILGPNGAGKTTIIRMIMGIMAPDSGTIEFGFGDGVKGVPKTRVGYLPEERGLYKDVRVIDILIYLAGLKGVEPKTARDKSMEWLEKFDLLDNARSKVEELSKGMAQKVQLIASVLHEPDLVVLDEPLSGLDPVSQDLMRTEITGLAERGASVLLSSHQMNLLEETCDRIMLMHRGEQVVYGPLQEVKAEYGNYRASILPVKGRSDEVESFLESSAVAKMVQTTQKRNSRFMVMLRDHVLPADFLSGIPQGTPIDEVSVARISLHDIFVKVAKGGLDDEDYPEGDGMGDSEESA